MRYRQCLVLCILKWSTAASKYTFVLMRNCVQHCHKLTTQRDRCHRFLSTHSCKSVGKSKPTVALDVWMKALLNTTRSTISCKVIVNCKVSHAIMSCRRFTRDAVRNIRKQKIGTLTTSGGKRKPRNNLRRSQEFERRTAMTQS